MQKAYLSSVSFLIYHLLPLITLRASLYRDYTSVGIVSLVRDQVVMFYVKNSVNSDNRIWHLDMSDSADYFPI